MHPQPAIDVFRRCLAAVLAGRNWTDLSEYERHKAVMEIAERTGFNTRRILDLIAQECPS